MLVRTDILDTLPVVVWVEVGVEVTASEVLEIVEVVVTAVILPNKQDAFEFFFSKSICI